MNFYQTSENKQPDPRNREIRKQVESALAVAPGVPSGRIDVSVDHGFIVLRGSVPNRHMKLAARKAAAGPEVGRGIVMQVRIEPDDSVSDARLADRVREALRDHEKIEKSTVAVSAHNGRITLTGTAGHDFQRVMAEDVALSVPGVITVKNLILVDLEEQIRNSEISSRIEQGLEYVPGVDEETVHVAVSGRSAVLSGTVLTTDQKERAERAVKKFPPVHIRNDLRVQGNS